MGDIVNPLTMLFGRIYNDWKYHPTRQIGLIKWRAVILLFSLEYCTLDQHAWSVHISHCKTRFATTA